MKTIDLSLTRKQLERVSEITVDEWIERFNALCKEFGSCLCHGIKDKCVEVRYFDVVEKKMTNFDLDCCVSTDDENAWFDSDILKLIEGKTITIKDGGFELEVTHRSYGLEFVTDKGDVIRRHVKSGILGIGHDFSINRNADRKNLDIHFLQFDNNPRRLAIETEFFSPDSWSEDYCPNFTKDETFCLERTISILKEEVDELLASDNVSEICKNCKWTRCPVYKRQCVVFVENFSKK